eukprot:Nk52_evm2s172 gene=Nk52_evmTU2s172
MTVQEKGPSIALKQDGTGGSGVCGAYVYGLVCKERECTGFCMTMEYRNPSFTRPSSFAREGTECPYLHGRTPVNGAGMRPRKEVLKSLRFVQLGEEEEEGVRGLYVWDLPDEYILKRAKALCSQCDGRDIEQDIEQNIAFRNVLIQLGRYPFDEYNELRIHYLLKYRGVQLNLWGSMTERDRDRRLLENNRMKKIENAEPCFKWSFAIQDNFGYVLEWVERQNRGEEEKEEKEEMGGCVEKSQGEKYLACRSSGPHPLLHVIIELCAEKMGMAELCCLSQTCRLFRDIANREIYSFLRTLSLSVDVLDSGRFKRNPHEAYLPSASSKVGPSGECGELWWMDWYPEYNGDYSDWEWRANPLKFKNCSDDKTFLTFGGNGDDGEHTYEYYIVQKINNRTEMDLMPTIHVAVHALDAFSLLRCDEERVSGMFGSKVDAPLLSKASGPGFPAVARNFTKYLFEWPPYNMWWECFIRLELIQRGEIGIQPAPDGGERVTREEKSSSEPVIYFQKEDKECDGQRWSLSYDTRRLQRSEIEANENLLSGLFDYYGPNLPWDDIGVEAISNIQISVHKGELLRCVNGRRFLKSPLHSSEPSRWV